MIAQLRHDLRAVTRRDPASHGLSRAAIALSYPGVQALAAHRAAHVLHRVGVPILPRAIAYLTRMVTGIEIHPAALIAGGLLIDHGAGVVIGETAAIGRDVTLYQGVTLGGTGFAEGKRHPTLEDHVVVGSGAKLLGPIRVGRGSKIGANSVVIHDVPPDSTVVGNPDHPVRVEGRRPGGPDADWVHLPDPVADAIAQLARRVAELEERLEHATGEKLPEPAQARPLRRVRGADSAGG